MITVAIADDDDLMRAGLRMILEQADDITVTAEAADGEEAVVIARTNKPTVMLMDIRMSNLNGIEATRAIAAIDDPPKVVVLTTFEHDEYVFGALRAGASGFLLKRTPPEALVDAIRTVAAGDALLAPSVTRRLIDAFADTTAGHEPATPAASLANLTDREAEILKVMAQGLSNAEIAERLFIAESTVKTHVKRVLMKLPARDRAQAVAIAYESGLMNNRSRWPPRWWPHESLR